MFRERLRASVVHIGQALREPEEFALRWHREGTPYAWWVFGALALTAIVGYGSFAFSHYPGLRSIGYASTFGIGLSGLAAITLLPAILVLEKHDEHDSASAQ